MTGLPVLDPAVVEAIKRLLDNIKNDLDRYGSINQIQEMVVEYRLAGNGAYRTLLKSVCDVLREKGYPQTADTLAEDWRL
jgi:uncharacterized protein (UPF0297 family)